MNDFLNRNPSSRPFKVADQIKKELAQIFQFELKDPRVGMLTVTDVRVTNDLSVADVYFSDLMLMTKESVLSEQELSDKQREIEKALGHANPFIRREIAKRVKLRVTPELRYHYDDLPREAEKIEAALSKAKAKDAKDAKDAQDEGTAPSPEESQDPFIH